MIKKVILVTILAAVALGYWLGVKDEGRTVKHVKESAETVGDKAREAKDKANEVSRKTGELVERSQKALDEF